MNETLYKILIIGDSTNSSIKPIQWHADSAEMVYEADPVIGLKLAQKGLWDLIIANIAVIGLPGLQIIKTAKSVNPWVPIIIISDYNKVEYTIASVKEHADGILFKPLQEAVLFDLAFNLIHEAEKKRNNEQKIVLAIGAHPDDIEIGCGGCLFLHQSHADKINFLTLSLGESGGDSAARKKESHLAAEMIHAHLFLENLADTYIPEGVETISLIEEVVKKIKPTHVYTHSSHDNHQDHRNVHLATMVACRSVANLFCYQSPSSTIDFKPGLFVEISSCIEKKIAILDVYKSQNATKPYLNKDMIISLARYWGRFSGYGLAEPLEVIRQYYK